MILDYREYTFRSGRVHLFLELFEKYGLAIQKRILGDFVGMYRTEVGNINTIVHIWKFKNMQDFQERRRKLSEDPDFKSYVLKVRELDITEHQETRILSPLPFSPDYEP